MKLNPKNRFLVAEILTECVDKLEAVSKLKPGLFLTLGWAISDGLKIHDAGSIMFTPMPRRKKPGRKK